jgi:tetratricopeptide (TPR) repeat protein
MTPADLQSAALGALRAGRLDEAERGFRSLLETLPHPAFLNNLGLVLVAQRRDEEAIPLFRRAIEERPADLAARIALSNALIQAGRPDEALATCDELLRMAPGNRDARHNRAVALRALARNEEAADVMASLFAEDAADADAELNLALAELMLGRYGAAWGHYEARWRGPRAQSPLPACDVPLWRPGESLRGRAVLVQSEQGLGDVIQFLRFVPSLAALASRVELQVPAPLLSLAARSLAPIRVGVQGDAPGAGLECRLGLLSLPLALGIGDPDGAPAYLRADPARIEAWGARLAPGRRVALAWRGNPKSRHDARRSMPVDRLAPFLEEAARLGLRVLCVQREVEPAEREFLLRFGHVSILGESLADFDDTAACLSLAEHVASVDTSIIHLAGALGRPATVMLQHASDWRWGIGRPEGSTYRSVRTLRQRSLGDWGSVVLELTRSLS